MCINISNVWPCALWYMWDNRYRVSLRGTFFLIASSFRLKSFRENLSYTSKFTSLKSERLTDSNFHAELTLSFGHNVLPSQVCIYLSCRWLDAGVWARISAHPLYKCSFLSEICVALEIRWDLRWLWPNPKPKMKKKKTSVISNVVEMPAFHLSTPRGRIQWESLSVWGCVLGHRMWDCRLGMSCVKC